MAGESAIPLENPSASGESPAAQPAGGGSISRESGDAAAVVNDSNQPLQLRMGLAMSGGIALVLYQSGVAHEALRFTRALSEGEHGKGYRAALEKLGIEPVIDIVTGASAGGINCVTLGNCIATGKSFDGFHDVWIKDADLAVLRYPTGVEPKSVLDPTALLTAVRKLMSPAGKGIMPDDGAWSSDLVTRICRTDYFGHTLTTTDAIGHKLEVESQASVVGFSIEDFVNAAYPEWAASPSGEKSAGAYTRGASGDAMADKPRDASARKLASVDDLLRAGASTSAFPVAFPAVQDPDGTGSWYIDGGLWNNQPLDLAVQAVQDKPAFGRTHRVIFVVQPDPLLDGAASTNRSEPSVGDVLVSVPMMGINGNLWPAIENILEFNRQGGNYCDLVSTPGVSGALTELGNNEITASAIYYRTRAHKDMPLLIKVRIQNILFDADPALVQQWTIMLRRLGALNLELIDTAWARAAEALLAIANADLISTALRRRIAENKQPDRYSKSVQYVQLELLSRYLYLDRWTDFAPGRQDDSAYQDTARLHSRFRADTEAMLAGLQDQLDNRKFWNAMAHGDDAIVPDRSKIDQILQRWVKAVEEVANVNVAFRDAACNPGISHPVAEDVNLRTRLASLRVVKSDQERNQVAARVKSAAAPEVTGDDAWQTVLSSISHVSSSCHIDLVRISPDDTSNINLIYDEKTAAGLCNSNPPQSIGHVKLAGELLGHFGGFFEERWRRNDYIWARLDAAEIFMRTLQQIVCEEAVKSGTMGKPGTRYVTEKEYQEWLLFEQTQILQEEFALWTSRPKDSPQPEAVPKDAPENEDTRLKRKANALLIGYGTETMEDLSQPRYSQNLSYLVSTIVKLMKGSEAQPPAALSLVERGMRLLSYVATALSAVMPVGTRPKTLNRAVVLVAIVVIAALGYGYLVGAGIAAAFTAVLAVAALLIAVGCVLGFRGWVYMPAAFIVGAMLPKWIFSALYSPTVNTWLVSNPKIANQIQNLCSIDLSLKTKQPPVAYGSTGTILAMLAGIYILLGVGAAIVKKIVSMVQRQKRGQGGLSPKNA